MIIDSLLPVKSETEFNEFFFNTDRLLNNFYLIVNFYYINVSVIKYAQRHQFHTQLFHWEFGLKRYHPPFFLSKILQWEKLPKFLNL